MRRVFLKTAIMLTIMLAVNMNLSAQFAGGDGTKDNPYIIETAAQLAQLATYVNEGNADYNSKYYQLGNNIDLSDYQSGEGWIPIGRNTNEFKGIFDGAGFKITGLVINRGSQNNIGLFGHIYDGEVKNLGVEDVLIKGNDNIGSIAGVMDNSWLSDCYSTGIINGNKCVGGLAGYLCEGFIWRCYTTGDVNGVSYVGGIIGFLIYANVENCAALNPNVKGTGNFFGRIIGNIDADDAHYFIEKNIAFDGMLNNSGNATWNNIGENNPDGENISRQAINTDGTLGGRFTAQYGWTTENGKLPGLFGNTVDMPFYLSIIEFSEGDGSEKTPYIITTASQLAQLATYVNIGDSYYNNKHYKLGNSISLSEYHYDEGWIPIGKYENNFKGVFDGAGFKITGLVINRGFQDYIGLFGYIYNGTVKNLGIEGASIKGKDNTGSIVGYAGSNSLLSNCYSTGDVNGGYIVGGLAGTFYGSLSNCCSSGTINGNISVGGLVGEFSGSVSNCYSTGNVNGGDGVGGVAGYNISGSLSNCYSTGHVSGNLYVGGVIGSFNSINASVSNCVALNQSVKAPNFASRVIGQYHYGTINNNAAFDGILNIDDNTTWNHIGANNLDGESISTLLINTDGTLGGRFTAEGGWTVENGYLPGLFGNNVEMPELLLTDFPVIVTKILPKGFIGVPYNQTLKANCKTSFIWVKENGNLPDGLTMSSSGVISGTPLQANNYIFTVKAVNEHGVDSKELSIFIGMADYPIIISTILPDGLVDDIYDETIVTTGLLPITLSLKAGSSIPNGLDMSNTGRILGVPTVRGVFAFTVIATNSAGYVEKELLMYISETGYPLITTTSLPNGKIGEGYNEQLKVISETPVTWSKESGDLPNGLTMTSTGIIIGVPTTNGDFIFTVKATGSTNSDTKKLSIKIGNVGINEELGIRNYELRVYPNPTKGEITVSARGHDPLSSEVEIFDVFGHCISPAGGGRGWRSHSVNSQFCISPAGGGQGVDFSGGGQGVDSPNPNEITLDISHLPNGIYFLRVNGKTAKIIKN